MAKAIAPFFCARDPESANRPASVTGISLSPAQVGSGDNQEWFRYLSRTDIISSHR
jgi:hypothetical protein